MERKDGLEGKRVIIFYDDGKDVSRKDGLVSNITDTFVELDYKILIPLNRVVRVEVVR